MRKAIWGMLVLGLLLCGCEKKTKTIYISEPVTDNIPPKITILSPQDGDTLFFSCWPIQDKLTCERMIFLHCIMTDNDSIKSVYLNEKKVNREDLARNYWDVTLYAHTFRHLISRYSYPVDHGTYTVKVYDYTGNIGWDSISITVVRK